MTRLPARQPGDGRSLRAVPGTRRGPAVPSEPARLFTALGTVDADAARHKRLWLAAHPSGEVRQDEGYYLAYLGGKPVPAREGSPDGMRAQALGTLMRQLIKACVQGRCPLHGKPGVAP